MNDGHHNGLGSSGESGNKSGPPDTKTGMSIHVPASTHALLIGVGEYQYQPWNIPVASNDAKALHDELIRGNGCCRYPPEQVTVLQDKDATRERIRGELRKLVDLTRRNRDRTIVIYYSGHGLFHEGQGYLVTHDAYPSDLPGTTLPASEFTETLRQIKADRLLVILDTCHAAEMAQAKNTDGSLVRRIPGNFDPVPVVKQLSEKVDEEEGRAVISSCRGDEKSWFLEDADLSIFTQHLLEALQGMGIDEASAPIEVFNLMRWVATQVVATAELNRKKQTPRFEYSGSGTGFSIGKKIEVLAIGPEEGGTRGAKSDRGGEWAVDSSQDNEYGDNYRFGRVEGSVHFGEKKTVPVS